MLLLLDQIFQLVHFSSNVLAPLKDIFPELNHSLEAFSWTVGDLSDGIAFGLLEELLVFFRLQINEHPKDTVVDVIVLHTLVLEPFSRVNVKVFDAQIHLL